MIESREHTLKVGMRLGVVVGRVDGEKCGVCRPMCSNVLTGGGISKRNGIDVIRQQLQSDCIIWFQGLDCSPGFYRVVINDDGMEGMMDCLR
jgi:hypothetical protein